MRGTESPGAVVGKQRRRGLGTRVVRRCAKHLDKGIYAVLSGKIVCFQEEFLKMSLKI